MKKSRPAVALYLALVFVSGAALGVVADRYYTATQQVAENSKGKGKRRPSPDEFRRGYLGFMTSRLELSEDQVKQLELILDETQTEVAQIVRDTRPEQQAVYRMQDVRIRSMLDEQQLPIYEQLLKDREERNRNKTRDPDKTRGDGDRGGKPQP